MGNLCLNHPQQKKITGKYILVSEVWDVLQILKTDFTSRSCTYLKKAFFLGSSSTQQLDILAKPPYPSQLAECKPSKTNVALVISSSVTGRKKLLGLHSQPYVVATSTPEENINWKDGRRDGAYTLHKTRTLRKYWLMRRRHFCLN